MSDARALTTISLADGTPVLVCGSHELAYSRSHLRAKTRAEVVSIAADRRRRRRRASPGDELAGMLADAFAPSRRGASERRRSG
jgi:hypothetical protein